LLFTVEAVEQVPDHRLYGTRRGLLEFIETLSQAMDSFLADARLRIGAPPEAAEPSPLKAKHLTELSLRFHESIEIENLIGQFKIPFVHVLV
jgi:hypothetical protein